MASAAILGMPAETCSCSFYMVFVNAALAYALSEKEKRCVSPTAEDAVDDYANLPDDLYQDEDALNDEDESPDEDPLAGCLDDAEPEFLGPNEDRCQEDQSQGYSTASVYTVNNNRIAVPQHLHYAFRGERLQFLNLYEWAALISVEPINKIVPNESSTTTNDLQDKGDITTHEANHQHRIAAGRPSNSTFQFAPEHPLFFTHVQRIRSKTKIPISVGRKPRPPVSKPTNPTSAWKKQAL